MGPKFCAQKGKKLGSQLGPMSITKLSPNWACQMGPIHCPKFLLPGLCIYTYIYICPHTHARTRTPQASIDTSHQYKHDARKIVIMAFHRYYTFSLYKFICKGCHDCFLKIGLKLRNLSEYF